MARRWVELNGSIASQCGVPAALHARELPSAEAYFQDLYCYQLIDRQPWRRGYQPIVGHGWHESRPLLFYAGQRLPPDFIFRSEVVMDVVMLVYWLATVGYYLVELDVESLFWHPVKKQVQLSDYQFFDPKQPEHYHVSKTTHQYVVKLLESSRSLQDLSQCERRRTLLRATAETLFAVFGAQVVCPIWQELAETRPEFHRPPLSMSEYLTSMIEEHNEKFQTERVYQSDAMTMVQTPPFECDSTMVPLYPFIGKLFNTAYLQAHYHDKTDNPFTAELRGVRMADLYDPGGRYHARLVRVCAHNGYQQLVYEYTGQPLTSLPPSLTEPSNKWWFYTGLLRLMNGLRLFHENDFVHGDVKPANITYTKFYTLKLIDFGLASCSLCPTFRLTVTDQWSYVAHPVELMLVADDRVDADLLQRAHDHSLSVVNIRGVDACERYYSVVKSVDFQTYRRQLLELDERERVDRVVKGTDVYGLGISLLLSLPEALLAELRDVLYHLLAPDVMERDLQLAQRQLANIVRSVVDC